MVLAAAFEELAAELGDRPDPPHAARVIPMGLFRNGPARGLAGEVRLCRAFLLRRGARMATPEIHRNSVQRLVSYRGRGRIHQGVPGGGPLDLRPRAIRSPGVGTQTDRGVDAPDVDTLDLGRFWDLVPAGVWHYPEAAGDEDWATVTFHSAAEDEIVDELWVG